MSQKLKQKKNKAANSEPLEETKTDSEDPFCLYSLLNIPKTATSQEIKKAYRVLALKFHPDKNPDTTEEARENFQKITKAYEILTNEEKKKLYDETGIIDGENSADFQNVYEYFRKIYKKVDTQDIENFGNNYKGKQEEENDLIQYYNDNKGDISKILENIILSTNDDIERFITFYDKMIENKQIKHFAKYDTSKLRIEKEKNEASKCEKNLKKSKKNNINDLALQIAIKNKGKKGYLDNLLDKWGGNTKPDLDDDEFEKIQKSLNLKKKKTH